MLGEVLAVAEVEQHGMPIGREEEIAAGVVQAIDLHIPRVAGVTDVDRVEEDDAGEIAARQGIAHPALAIEPQRDGIERRINVECRAGKGDGSHGFSRLSTSLS
jgi:hypothetical protein